MNSDNHQDQGGGSREQQWPSQSFTAPLPREITHGEFQLFGPAQPAVTISGTHAALDHLNHAMIFHGLFVHPYLGPNLNKTLRLSFQYLQRLNEFPPEHGPYSLRSIQPLSREVHRVEVHREQMLDASLQPEDFHFHLAHSLAGYGWPPFSGQIDTILKLLNIAGKLQEQRVLGTYQHGRRFVYQLGIVTMLSNGLQSTYQAQVFPANTSEVATHTIFSYRECYRDHAAPWGFEQTWYPFGDDYFNPYQIVQPPLVQRPPHLPQQLPPRHGEDNEGLTGDASNADLMDDVDWQNLWDTIEPDLAWLDPWVLTEPDAESNTPAAPVQAPGERPPRRRPRTSSGQQVVTNLNDLTFDQILNGAAGRIRDEAKIISKDVILHIAESHSNTEIFNRIQATLNERGLRLIRNANVITRRIIIAVERRATQTSRTKQEVRAELDEKRRKNGIRVRNSGSRAIRAADSALPAEAELETVEGIEERSSGDDADAESEMEE